MPERESIWTVPSAWRTLFWILFPVNVAIYTGIVAWYEIAVRTNDSGFETFEAIGRGSSPYILLSVVSTTIMVEVIFMLSEWLQKRAEKKGREEGREEGLEQGLERGRVERDAQWQAWLERRDRAMANGEPFAEPPPSQIQSNGTAG